MEGRAMTSRADDIVVASPPIAAELIRDREWWVDEAACAGSDWPGVIRTALAMLTMAGLIASEPSTFEWACEQADRRRQDISPRRIAPPRNRRAPEATVEGLAFSLRRGVNELLKPDTQRRLSALDADQLEAVCLRVQAFKPAIAEPWSAEDADLLISAWRKLREQC
jgi:hypothetical protein